MNLTKDQLNAIDKIGRSRRSRMKIGKGKPISTRMFNTLKKKGLVMWLDEAKKEIMLTYPGERIFTKLHPTSKYKIK